MKVAITATATTSYQYNSLRHFGIGCNNNGNGSYSGIAKFETKKEARAFLRERAQMYFGNSTELQEALKDIRLLDYLTINAVTAYIDPIN